MEKSTRIVSQVYGYAICLVAVITFIFSSIAFINSVLDLGDPLHAGFTPAGAPSLSSFEHYKMDVMKTYQKNTDKAGETATLDDATLKRMYDAAREDKISASNHQSRKSLIISGIILLFSIILFITHWKWMRRINANG